MAINLDLTGQPNCSHWRRSTRDFTPAGEGVQQWMTDIRRPSQNRGHFAVDRAPGPSRRESFSPRHPPRHAVEFKKEGVRTLLAGNARAAGCAGGLGNEEPWKYLV